LNLELKKFIFRAVKPPRLVVRGGCKAQRSLNTNLVAQYIF
jgi:hypothetical protein